MDTKDAWFQQMFQHNPAVQLLIEAETGKITDANPAAVAFYGYTRDELLQRNITEINTLPEAEIRAAMATVRHQQQTTFDVQHRLANGTLRDVYVLTNLLNIQGTDYLYSIIVDMTERNRQVQQRLQAAIEEEQLRVMAQFIESVSHEFRTPLSVIETNLYMLLRAKDPAIRNTRAANIRDQIKRMTTLVESMLMLVRLESRHQPLHNRVNLNDVVFLLQNQYAQAIKDRKITLIITLDDDLPSTLANMDAITDAAGQLMHNAIRYTDEGGHITLRTSQRDGEVVLMVKDSGRGITAENLPKIFDRFFRVDTAHSTPGFGLGLPIAKKVASLHNGTIEVTTEPGVGSTFRLVLPVVSPD